MSIEDTLVNESLSSLHLPRRPADGERLLYVVLHGLVSLVETPEDFQAILMSMGSEHQYFGGTWLAEKEIPAGARGLLKGVVSGNATLDAVSNPVLNITAMPPLDHPNIHALLALPKPRAIHYRNRGTITIAGGRLSDLAGTPDTLSAVRVFEYLIEGSYDEVWVDGLGINWICRSNFTAFEENDSAAASLHIFDSPAGPVSDSHHVDEFLLSSRVLGSPIRIGAAIPADVPNEELPPGLAEFELSDFGDRDVEIADVLLDFLRTGKFEPRESIGGSCQPCCGAVDARKRT